MKTELIFLLLAAAFSLFQWLAERRKKEGGQEQGEGQMRRLTEQREKRAQQRRFVGKETTEEERVRKFMEALGLPTEGPIRAPQPPPEPPTQSAPVMPKEVEKTPEPVLPAPPPAQVRQSSFPQARKAKEVDRAFPKAKPSPYTPPVAPAAEAAAPSFASMIPGLSMPVTTSMSEVAAPMEIHTGAPGKTPSTPLDDEALIDFSSPRALRRAFVMSEVLGQPKGLTS